MNDIEGGIKSFAMLASPLYKLLKNDAQYHWREEHQQAFDTLKAELSKAPVLAAPVLGRPFQIWTDASKVGLAGVLLQQDSNNVWRPVCYSSRSTNRHEMNYVPIELEALAIVFALKTFHPFVAGAQITILTEYQPLKALLYRTEQHGRLLKYQLIIQQYSCSIEYRPGKWNYFADQCSRAPLTPEELRQLAAVVEEAPEVEPVLSVEWCKKIQKQSDWLKRIFNYLQGLYEPDDLEEFRQLRKESKDFIILNNLIYQRKQLQKNKKSFF